MSLKIGSLFSGYGGLDLGIESALDAFGLTGEPAWFCEFDEAPSRILAHHWPDVPNLGDITKVDWSAVEPVDVLCGGFPCQDVSLAGARRGIADGTRSGLWSEFAKAIDILRPRLVVIENVRGLLSATASNEMESCSWCVGDEPDQYALRALGAVLGDLADLGFDAAWRGVEASDVGAPHRRFRVFIVAWPRSSDADGGGSVHGWSGFDSTIGGSLHSVTLAQVFHRPDIIQGALMPTPDAYAGSRGGSQSPEKRRAGGHTVSLADVAEFEMLPTPLVSDGTGGAKNIAGSEFHQQMRDIAQLLPTPTTSDANGVGEHGTGGRDLRTEISLLPTPNTMEHLPVREGEAYEKSLRRGDPDGSRRSGASNLREAVVHDLPPAGTVREHATDFGQFAPAVNRWETVFGHPAPAPLRPDGKNGAMRLSPEFTEWMMGLCPGWVTDPAIWTGGGLTDSQIRNAELKACGNGVVPQQAAHAIAGLLNVVPADLFPEFNNLEAA